MWKNGTDYIAQMYKCSLCGKRVRESLKGNQTSCRNPSVQNCLNCTKPDCDCPIGFPVDESEIIAQIYAGVLQYQALAFHRRMINRRKAGAVP